MILSDTNIQIVEQYLKQSHVKDAIFEEDLEYAISLFGCPDVLTTYLESKGIHVLDYLKGTIPKECYRGVSKSIPNLDLVVDLTNVEYVEESAFADNDILYIRAKDSTKLKRIQSKAFARSTITNLYMWIPETATFDVELFQGSKCVQMGFIGFKTPYISSYTFGKFEGLETEVCLTKHVNHIDEGAFANCQLSKLVIYNPQIKVHKNAFHLGNVNNSDTCINLLLYSGSKKELESNKELVEVANNFCKTVACSDGAYKI